jgi:hypothetical protein
MKMRYKLLIFSGVLLLTLSVILAACGPEVPVPPAPEIEPLRTPVPVQPTPVPLECPDPVCPEPEVAEGVQVPFHDLWVASPHADPEAVAFTYWDDPDRDFPVVCARCHSTEGYVSFMGADGSEFGVVEQVPERGSIITCTACHNEATMAIRSVTFPSGAIIPDLGNEATCMRCHQGRSSHVQVQSAIEAAGATDDVDEVLADLTFINIHYYAAAATQYGSLVMGGYQYEGLSYDPFFHHVEGFNQCQQCHDPHSLEVRVESCVACHPNAATEEGLRNIRMEGSLVDYDGDGDVTEGLYYEVQGLQEMLFAGIQQYAAEVSETPIGYANRHPYFFIDTDGSGEITDDEAVPANRYNAWTPRLLQAAYNYQVSKKDPGAFAHGGKYIIQILYDSIDNLNEALPQPIDLTNAHREDPGHFQASAQAFRYWDEQGIVPADCSKCHTATGLPLFLAEAARSPDQVTGRTIGLQPTSGLYCSTCHDDVQNFTIRQVEAVRFPSGAILTLGEENNLCMNCHQGREANQTVKAAIQRAGVDDDEVSPALAFRNPHYFGAAATLFGTEAQGAFEYEDEEYNGRFLHVPNFNTCVQCHDPHSLEIRLQACSACHTGVQTLEDLRAIRFGSPPLDFDGDGELKGIGEEIETMHGFLYEAILQYALENPDTAAIAYADSFPYWFIDQDEDGVISPAERTFANRYNTWTPRLLAAAYNYKWVASDPGAFAHNGLYIIQILYDSLESLEWDVTDMERPPVEQEPAE